MLEVIWWLISFYISSSFSLLLSTHGTFPALYAWKRNAKLKKFSLSDLTNILQLTLSLLIQAETLEYGLAQPSQKSECGSSKLSHTKQFKFDTALSS